MNKCCYRKISCLPSYKFKQLTDCTTQLANKQENSCCLVQKLMTVKGITDNQVNLIARQQKIKNNLSNTQDALEQSFRALILNPKPNNLSVIKNFLDQGTNGQEIPSRAQPDLSS